MPTDLKLTAAEARALEMFEADDLSDPVALVERAGRNKATFFEYGRFHGLDVSRSDISGVSFRGAILTGTILRKDQMAQITATGPRQFSDHASVVFTPHHTTSYEIENAVEAYEAARERIERARADGARELHLTLGKKLEEIPVEIAQLERLRLIDLDQTGIVDLSPLAQLKELETLYLSDTPITNIAPLAQLNRLQTLDLRNTSVSDIAPLSNLIILARLHLGTTQVADITPLSSIDNLKTLSLCNTIVTNIAPLSGKRKLETIDLRNTRVTDIAPLSRSLALRSLLLNNAPITDIKHLSSAVNLQTLSINNTIVDNIEPLSHLKNLQSISLAYSQVANITALGGLPQLNRLIIQGTPAAQHDWPMFTKGVVRR